MRSIIYALLIMITLLACTLPALIPCLEDKYYRGLTTWE